MLGIVEGATEFIPVSSTGHLILVGHVIGFEGSRAAVFEIVIQLGAILAVVWNSRAILGRWLGQAARQQEGTAAARAVLLNLLIAFTPAAVVGLLTHHWITAHLFKPSVVGIALILGGFAIRWSSASGPCRGPTKSRAFPNALPSESDSHKCCR